MGSIIDFVSQPWPWYVAGPLIGLFVPALLIFGGKQLGLSSNLRHVCAATVPGRQEFFRYDWKRTGTWNLVMVLGIMIGGFIGLHLLASPGDSIDLSERTVGALSGLGVSDLTGFVPAQFISWKGLATLPGLVMVVGGGFFVGFGARYAGGCTSGHAISGLANLQVASLVAVVGFFIGGLFVTFVLLPVLL